MRKSFYNVMIELLETTKTPKTTFIQKAIIERAMRDEVFQKKLLDLIEDKYGKDFVYYDTKQAFDKVNALKKEYSDAAKVIVETTYNILD